MSAQILFVFGRFFISGQFHSQYATFQSVEIAKEATVDKIQEVGGGKAAIESWKAGFEGALTNWKNAAQEDKPKMAKRLLSYVGSTGMKLVNFVDSPSIGIDQKTADQILADYANR